jgi:endoglucanase
MRRALVLSLATGLVAAAAALPAASVSAAVDPKASAAVTPVTPVTMTSGFYADPDSVPATWVRANSTDPRAARIQASIGSRSIAKWFGNWATSINASVSAYVDKAEAVDKLPTLVAYNLPGRDACGGHSGGGAASDAEYRTWISDFSMGIGTRPAVVIIEPDALGDFACMDATAIAARNSLLTYATQQFKANAPNTWAYLDGGNAKWVAADVMAKRLHDAGVVNVRGFSLNVSNYYTTAQSATYGNSVNSQLSKRGYTRPFVVDTSRNLNGSNGQWCNPAGRKLGVTPQVGIGEDLKLWIKTPGSSDGLCGIAPTTPAGTFNPDLAIRLIDGV